MIESSLGLAFQNQLQHFAATTNFLPSNAATLPPGSTGTLDCNRLQEETYMHASRGLVAHFKSDVSTQDNVMKQLSSLLGNSTIIRTGNGDFNTRALSSSVHNHRASNNRLLPDSQSLSPKKKRQGKAPQATSFLQLQDNMPPPLFLPLCHPFFLPTRLCCHPTMTIMITSTFEMPKVCYREQCGDHLNRWRR